MVNGSTIFSLFIAVLIFRCCVSNEQQPNESEKTSKAAPKLYSIEGTVEVFETDISVWGPDIQILIDGGKYINFLKANGDFKIHGLTSGSFLVEVVHPNYLFEPVRVDISGKTGKIRARRINVLKPGSVEGLPYPLKFQTYDQAEFFEKREAWNILDMLKNPMVLFLVAPLLLMLVLPKLLNNMDPDTHKEMQESIQNFQNPSNSLPSMEEMFTNFFSGGSKKKTK